MTIRKSEIALASRLTAYVTREEGAAELRVSPSTWDEMVDCGQLPKPHRLGRMESILRWRWANVDSRLRGLSGQDDHHADPEPYFRERVRHGTTKERKREAA
jgi:predicted DNA-binding transcriptional regulator AlpA